MTEEKTDWKGIALPIIVVLIIFGVGYLIGQYQKGGPLPEGIGTGENDFWTITTEHPTWAVSATQTGPVLIFAHSTSCSPCITQTEINENIYSTYQRNISYFNIISGTDEPEVAETFDAYDPDGAPHYIPLTIVVTNGPDGTLVWHSWEGVVEEDVLSAWMDDAIEYYEQYG